MKVVLSQTFHLYYIRGKTTERWLVETESIFFLITRALLVIKRAWLLDPDWLSARRLHRVGFLLETSFELCDSGNFAKTLKTRVKLILTLRAGQCFTGDMLQVLKPLSKAWRCCMDFHRTTTRYVYLVSRSCRGSLFHWNTRLLHLFFFIIINLSNVKFF